jgi:hypothetical protein
MTDREQKLLNVAKASLPRWLFADGDPPAIVADAKVFARLWDQLDEWIDATYLTRAPGIWLDQHAVDRNTRRQAGETDAALAERLRHPLDAITLPALTARAQAIVDAEGIGGTVTILELRRVRAFVGSVDNPHSFVSNGYRIAGTGQASNQLIVVLPYGSTTGTAAAVYDAIRQAKAAGVGLIIERRLNPT